MRPTRFTAPGSAPSEDLDTPAYTRALTPLPELQRTQALQAADRVDASNRTFNQQFWATLASEAGGAPIGIDLTRLARWVSRTLGRRQPRGSASRGDKHKW